MWDWSWVRLGRRKNGLKKNGIPLIKSLQYRANFVCLGGPKESTQYKPLMDSLTAEGIDQIMLNMLGKTTLQEVGALIESCDVVVTADTGSLAYCISA